MPIPNSFLPFSTFSDAVMNIFHFNYFLGPLYLRRNFLKAFTNLKVVFIGEKSFPGPTGLMNPVKYIYDYRGGIVKRTCRQIVKLGVYARINYESGNLYHIIEKFINLVKIEFDTFKPIFNDKDVQAIISHLPLLTYISISHSDLITDEGVSGIGRQVCKNLHNLSTLYTEPNLQAHKLRVGGRPLSDLKGKINDLITLMV